MSFLPKYASPCDLAKKIPDDIAELLQAEEELGKRFREETITDLFVASLRLLPIENLIVAIPNELRTGSDLDIAVISGDRSDAVQFRIQAKRLSPHQNDWKISTYKEIAHPHNSGQQARTLVRSSASERIPTVPLYAFYNPALTVQMSKNEVSGLELASAREVSFLVRKMVTARPKRLPYKRIGNLKHLFFPLTSLLCGPFAAMSDADTTGAIPSPSKFRDSVETEISKRSANFFYSNEPDRVELRQVARTSDQTRRIAPEGRTDLNLPEKVSQTKRRDSLVPAYVDRILDLSERRQIVIAPIKRPKIILQSD